MNKDLYKTHFYQFCIDKDNKDFDKNNDYLILNDIPANYDIPTNLQGYKNIRFEVFNKELKKGDIPNGVIKLCFGKDFLQKLEKGVIPDSVKYLEINADFNLYNNKENLYIPSTVKTLVINTRYMYYGLSDIKIKTSENTIPSGIIPYGVEKLYIYKDIGLEEGSIPDSVHTLHIDYIYNFTANYNKVIPKSVINLSLKTINSIRPNCLHDTIKKLEIGFLNYHIDLIKGFIPNNVIELVFGEMFNSKLLHGSIPLSVKKITFGDSFNRDILPGVLPNNLNTLIFGNLFNRPLYRKSIPDNLEYLIFGNNYNQPFDNNIIPKNLKSIIFGKGYNQKILKNILPHGLKKLVFDTQFNQKITEGVIPNTVEYLIFGYYFNQPLEINSIPHSVKHLEFEGLFNHPIDNILPPDLKYLKFRYFNQSLSNLVLPRKLTHLILGYSFSGILNPGDLPESLIHLELSNKYDDIIGFHKPFIHYINPNTENIYPIYIDVNRLVKADKYLPDNIIPKNIRYLKIGENFSHYINYNTLNNLIHIVVQGTNKDIISHNLPSDCIMGISYSSSHRGSLKRYEIYKFIYYFNNVSYKIYQDDIDIFNKDYIENYLQTKEKRNKLFQELIETIYDPIRLNKLASIYNISFTSLMDNY